MRSVECAVSGCMHGCAYSRDHFHLLIAKDATFIDMKVLAGGPELPGQRRFHFRLSSAPSWRSSLSPFCKLVVVKPLRPSPPPSTCRTPPRMKRPRSPTHPPPHAAYCCVPFRISSAPLSRSASPSPPAPSPPSPAPSAPGVGGAAASRPARMREVRAEKRRRRPSSSRPHEPPVPRPGREGASRDRAQGLLSARASRRSLLNGWQAARPRKRQACAGRRLHRAEEAARPRDAVPGPPGLTRSQQLENPR
jgi:hypothetical protein